MILLNTNSFDSALANKKTTAGDLSTLVVHGHKDGSIFDKQGGQGNLPIRKILIRMKPIVRQDLV